uniref:Sema domain, transmembrane domain (TM), and cytoplasmic domain, (semaphorin) 6A n=1 Tax=Callorhinchus milii TaxID=7868 RepID=A0A4W3JHG0_CALMI
MDTSFTEQINFNKKLTWRSKQADIDICRMKGKRKDECHNFIKLLLKRNDETLFVCGTNAFNPSCRNYKLDTLDFLEEEISGMARCPYDPKHANVALFAEPYFVQAVDYGDYIYFFFREIAVEYNSMGKVIFPRVARVCKNDMGGSQRVLEKQWTSFIKARLNCSVPGDSHFYFNILQSVTDIVHIDGRDVVLAIFSTPYNSIPGSAVCAYDMADVATVFTGRFKEQKSSDSTWTPVAEERVPKPRPGCCAGSMLLERYATSNEFPDDTLNFIKTHPLLDEAVPSIDTRPWFQRTMVRYRLTKIAVDNAAGPYQNYTVVFLGSERGVVLKFLAKTGIGIINDSVFLEEINIYNSEKCSTDGVEDRRIVGMQLDKLSDSLYVAFSTCVVKVPLARCERHGRCKKTCIASRDPYCGWLKKGVCAELSPAYLKGHDQLVPVTLLAIAVILAFIMGAVFSGIIVYCICDHRRRDIDLSRRKEKESSHSRRASMASVTKLGGLFDTQTKDPKPEALLTPLMHNGRMVTPNGTTRTLIKADQHHLDLTALPTPESTPTLQQKRRMSRGSSQWERNQNLINACTKDLGSMGSPVISMDLPLHASPNHIPSVVVLPTTQQSFQHEYGDQGHRSDMGHMTSEDQNATLEYRSMKSPCHGLVASLDHIPPKVPQREASLASNNSGLPHNGLGKRLDVPSASYAIEYKRNYPSNSLQRNPQTSAFKRNHNTNSSNSSHLSRNQSFNRGENPPPAPQRVDSMLVSAGQSQTQAVTISRRSSINAAYNSLPRSGVKRTASLKPDVPPKPMFVPLSNSMKPNDGCT